MYAIRIVRITRSIAAAALWSLAWGSHLCAQTELSFIARRDFQVGGPAVSVTVADFNRDGHQDLATVNDQLSSGMVSILLGRGDGTFQAARDLTLGARALFVTAGDFNADGRLDLVTGGEKVSILLGNGDGTFQTAREIEASARCVIVGDFNGDGRQDLVILESALFILLGNGDGTFQAAKDVAPGYYSVTAGDFNRDGRQDLAATSFWCDEDGNCEGGTVSILLGNGDGTFKNAMNVKPGGVLTSVTVGDFNGDGRQDLVTNGLVLLGEGNGAFQILADPGVGGYSVTAGDFNADGRQDLATANYSGTVSILLGKGDGTFVAEADLAVGGPANSVAVGDFNEDGRQDLATPNFYYPTISILLGNGDGTFRVARDVGVGGYGDVVSVVVSDFNADGRQDLATVGHFSNNVSVFLGNGEGTFQIANDFGVGGYPNSMAVGDFNGDGRQDLVTVGESVFILLGNGDGTFQTATGFGVGASPFSVTVGDFNGDGRPDLAMARPYPSVSILLGKGDGTFQRARDSAVGGVPFSVTVGDFNGDGRQDLATANYLSATVSILLGRGNGTFQTARDFAMGGGSYANQSITVGDFNGDGRQDLATANGQVYSRGTVSVLLGKGDGTFQTARDFGVGASPYSVTVGDFNGDGRQDLATANHYVNSVSILLGKGDGTFQTARDFGVGASPYSVTVGDFNGDGRQDLAVANIYANSVSILINDSALKAAIEIVGRKINPKSHGQISAAILTTDSFDATAVDTTTVHFGATGTEAAPVRVDLRDVDHDGDIDMVLSFEIQETGIPCGSTSATLAGKTLTGQFILGSDSFETVGCKK